MATCHICGAYVQSGQGYRRDVYTGSSVGTRSSRAYSGVRTLCRRCASAHDRRKVTGFVVGVCCLLGGGAWWLSNVPSPRHSSSVPEPSLPANTSPASPSELKPSGDESLSVSVYSDNVPQRGERKESEVAATLDTTAPTPITALPPKAEKEESAPRPNAYASSVIPSSGQSLKAKDITELMPSTHSSPIAETPPQVEQVRTTFQQNWKPSEEVNSTVQYRLTIGSDGVLKGIEPIGGSAARYLSQAIVALIGQTITTPSLDGQSSQIRVVVTRDGQVKTVLE
jgi:hypothetical protein